jgi:hypothetical protein
MLSAADRAAAGSLLQLPLAAQTADLPTVARLQRGLDEYLTGHTEIVLH